MEARAFNPSTREKEAGGSKPTKLESGSVTRICNPRYSGGRDGWRLAGAVQLERVPKLMRLGVCSSEVEPRSLREVPGSTPTANYKTEGCGPEAVAGGPGTGHGEVPGCCKPQAPSAVQASPSNPPPGTSRPPHIQVPSAASTHSRAAWPTRAAPEPWSGSPGSAQARLGAPHSRLPRADTERTASAPREAARTIKTSREPPRAEASAAASGGGRAGFGKERR